LRVFLLLSLYTCISCLLTAQPHTRMAMFYGWIKLFSVHCSYLVWTALQRWRLALLGWTPTQQHCTRITI
jgi:hypothetical protein